MNHCDEELRKAVALRNLSTTLRQRRFRFTEQAVVSWVTAGGVDPDLFGEEAVALASRGRIAPGAGSRQGEGCARVFRGPGWPERSARHGG